MKGLFGLVGLLVALAVIGVVVKQQLAASRQTRPALAPVAAPQENAGATAGTVREQSQNIQQQYKQAVEGALQQARPLPDDK